ncbi:diphosphomevalonate decarboxylase [Physocladia obscura]|uniref:diphosphomevalonate decarboxylase n=1 Tax=Physocladia obscura TaxID=109957 RepID=A0AAD5T0I3_9FUNG|nr:diphosphomevalonate decarboxylase [Physocladia obscura]
MAKGKGNKNKGAESKKKKQAAASPVEAGSNKRARETDGAVTHEATATAPVNIAVIKYWGKRNEALMLPTNSSLSLTLDQDQLQSRTSVRVRAERGDAVRLWLNGREEKLSARMLNLVAAMRRLRREKEEEAKGAEELASRVLHVASVNNFPTAAGLASSASGLACLAVALDAALGLDLPRAQLSALARLGSGSACRSLFGGFVAWDAGVNNATGADSVARQVAPETHWPAMCALVLVASADQKEMPSSRGMQATVDTSPLLLHRAAHVVPERMRAIERAIRDTDFDAFAELTMRDSNQFHAVCLDTFPPIFYLNSVSQAVIALVTRYNELKHAKDSSRRFTAAYTFDAGPNAVLYLLKEDVPEVLRLVNAFFPHPSFANDNDRDEYYGQAKKFLDDSLSSADTAALEKELVEAGIRKFPQSGGIKRIIYSDIGDGPRILGRGPDSRNVSLLNDDGLPK